jgi:mannonate dehydratase
VPPNEAVELCKELERYRPFYVEDALSPEDIGYFRLIHSQCSTPLALGEWFNVRTAWHGPADVSPVGHCAKITLDIHTRNFGIQEQTVFGKESQEVFPGCPKIKDGYYWVNEAPGWGIWFDEKLAAASLPLQVRPSTIF